MSIDLYSVRAELIAMRTEHADNPAVTLPINKLLSKIAHLDEPRDARQERRLRRIIDATFAKVSEIIPRK